MIATKTYKNVSDLLLELCLDDRVTDGVFNINNNEHMEILREKLLAMGINESEVKSMSNKVLEGKYPDRQAYNARGILVTFPDPSYKQRAIQRGTHFQDDPTKGQANIDFSGDQTATAQPVMEPVGGQGPVQMPPTGNVSQQPQIPPHISTIPPTVTSQNDLRNRSPVQISIDQAEVEKLLTTELTLEEATQKGWVRDNLNRWYGSDGVLKGHEWYCLQSHQKKILPVR